MAGRTTFLVAHPPETIQLAERILLLDQGRLIAEGSHEALQRDSGLYRTLLAEMATGPDTDGRKARNRGVKVVLDRGEGEWREHLVF